jgi:hypothetical protein
MFIRISYTTINILITHDSIGNVCSIYAIIFNPGLVRHCHSPLFILQCSSAGLPAAGRKMAAAPVPAQAVTTCGESGSARGAGRRGARWVTASPRPTRAAATGREGKPARAAGQVGRTESAAAGPARAGATSVKARSTTSAGGSAHRRSRI